MTALTWAIRLVIFSLLLLFALRNTQVVTLHFVPGYQWDAPLVITLLAFFAGGALLGALSLVGVIFRQRREIGRLKRESASPSAPAAIDPPATA
ncbi:MAG: LapA family protein [Betaproteobacteria bacterium]|nr:LapA family protein [Betaproteobacteria bacterium]